MELGLNNDLIIMSEGDIKIDVLTLSDGISFQEAYGVGHLDNKKWSSW